MIINSAGVVVGIIACLMILFAVYERGQRKAWQAAEKLYAPLLSKIAARLDTSVHSIPEKLERGTPPDYVEEN
jgi:hypothetical protein